MRQNYGETAYFLAAGGSEMFIPWAENCKAEKLAQCTEEEKAYYHTYNPETD